MRNRSGNNSFPVLNISGRSVKSGEITPNLACFWFAIFLEGNAKCLNLHYKAHLISNHVAKFHDDRPKEGRDLALKKTSAAKHKPAGNHRSGRSKN